MTIPSAAPPGNPRSLTSRVATLEAALLRADITIAELDEELLTARHLIDSLEHDVAELRALLAAMQTEGRQ